MPDIKIDHQGDNDSRLSGRATPYAGNVSIRTQGGLGDKPERTEKWNFADCHAANMADSRGGFEIARGIGAKKTSALPTHDKPQK